MSGGGRNNGMWLGVMGLNTHKSAKEGCKNLKRADKTKAHEFLIK